MKEIVLLVVITLIPALELRASIPWGIFKMNATMHWVFVVCVCTVANIILGWIVFNIMAPVFTFVRKWGWFDRTIWPLLEKTQYRIHPYVEKYGELGAAVFIGIPLPGSGVYTGAFGSYLLGLNRRKFIIANIIGVLIAATAVTTLCLLISWGFVGKDSLISQLFLKLDNPVKNSL